MSHNKLRIMHSIHPLFDCLFAVIKFNSFDSLDMKFFSFDIYIMKNDPSLEADYVEIHQK